MTLFNNKYRIETIRLKEWNYAASGWYFITICTYNRTHLFGKMAESGILLNEIGSIAAQCWQEIPQHFSQTTLDQFVVMPNHIHGIVIIDSEPSDQTATGNVETRQAQPSKYNRVASPTLANQFGPLVPGSLSKIIQAYKAAVTRWCKAKQQPNFNWQPRFYDHIIRNERSLKAIREYIVNNPAQWDLDQDKPQGLWM